jgi:hypothetical protein
MTANALADCQAVVILIDPEHVSRPPQAALQAAFGLSEAEARLAARLAAGEALELTTAWHRQGNRPKSIEEHFRKDRRASAS